MKTANTHTDFYRTGFEELYIDGSRLATSEAVISSVMPFDGELLIIGNSDICTTWRHICHNLSINVSVIDGQDTEDNLKNALEAVMNSNKRITHVICSSERSTESMSLIGSMVKEYKKSLIVDNANDGIDTNNMNAYGIDFLITAEENCETLIVARRSRLVQTEGNARRACHDIYAMWQNNMSMRRATLEPMAC
ncbi:MAG: hypothetical protein MJZ13_01995 [Bacteroidales bacterium]|nr:hypothetical protein [Bacteroidales bacterium]